MLSQDRLRVAIKFGAPFCPVVRICQVKRRIHTNAQPRLRPRVLKLRYFGNPLRKQWNTDLNIASLTLRATKTQTKPKMRNFKNHGLDRQQ